jgi:hypothetical protein
MFLRECPQPVSDGGGCSRGFWGYRRVLTRAVTVNWLLVVSACVRVCSRTGSSGNNKRSSVSAMPWENRSFVSSSVREAD